ncbi:hypothetical protein ABZ791_27310 [Streptomyces huasconensis]|uniref:Secreted protein n=1 Tax=Streptomyces huasconensis TaxID=1854574 RepID=A0ABV3LXN3_9ACTN
MIAVAVLLLPGLAVLLCVVVRLEDGLYNAKGRDSSVRHARHARRQHLRLIPGGRSDVSSAMAPTPAPVAAGASASKGFGPRMRDRNAA